MRCVIEPCDRPVMAQGWWCDTHHAQLQIGGAPKTVSARNRIMQILEVDGGWMTHHMVVADFDMRWPGTKERTIHRAFHRLSNTQRVATRQVEGSVRTGWNGVSIVNELRAL